MFKKLGKSIGNFFTKEIPRVVTQDIPRIVTQDIPKVVTQDVPKFVKEDVADFVKEDVADFITEDVPEFITEDIPEGAKTILTQKQLKKDVEALRKAKQDDLATLTAARERFFDLSLRYTQLEAVYRARLEIYHALPKSHLAETDIDHVEDVNYDRATSGLHKIGQATGAVVKTVLTFVTFTLADFVFKPFELQKEKEHLEGELIKIKAAIAEITTAETGLTEGLADIETALAKLDAVLEARGLQFQSNPEDRMRFDQIRAERRQAVLRALLAEGTDPAVAHRVLAMPHDAARA